MQIKNNYSGKPSLAREPYDDTWKMFEWLIGIYDCSLKIFRFYTCISINLHIWGIHITRRTVR